MKLGINLLLFGAGLKKDAAAIMENIREIGYSHVEIPVFENNLPRCRELAQIVADCGLTASISSALPAGASLAGSRRELRAAEAFHEMLVESALVMGANPIAGPLYHPVGRMIVPFDRVRLHSRLEESLAVNISPIYTKAGLRFALEPLNRFETNVVNTCADATTLCGNAGEDWLGILTDTFHQHMEEVDSATPLRTLGNRWIHAHASENHRGIAGSGQVAWKNWAPVVLASGPDLVVFESFGPTIPELAAATRTWRDLTGDPFVCARRSFQFLDSLLNTKSL